VRRLAAMKHKFCVLLSLNLLFGSSGGCSWPKQAGTQSYPARSDQLKIAKVEFRLGRMEAAEKDLQLFLKEDPRNPEAHYYLNLIKEWRTKEKFYQESLKLGLVDLWYPTLPPRKAE